MQWPEWERSVFASARAEFLFSSHSLGGCGRWRYLHREHTFKIIMSLDHLENQLEIRLNPYSCHPVLVTKVLDASCQNIPQTVQCPAIDTLRSVVQCILTIGRKHEAVSHDHKHGLEVALNPLIQWTDDSICRAYPEPDLDSICTNPAHRRASILILRHPTMYDGDTGFALLRYMRAALRLLFSELNASFISESRDHQSEATTCQTPFLVVCDGKEFTGDACHVMAKAVHPTLVQLLRLYGEKNTLPSHCFVYGIHLSPMYLTLCVHFPTRLMKRTTGVAGWYFRQVVVARYLVAADPIPRNIHEDLLLTRWRLLISLLTVVKHMQLLGTELQHHNKEPHVMRTDSVEQPSRALDPQSLPGDLNILRRVWKRTRLPIPSEWTTPIAPGELDFTNPYDLTGEDLGRDLLHQLTSHILEKLNRHIALIPSTLLTQNHLNPNYRGPDFLLPRHSPLNHFNRRSREVVQDPLHNTHTHMYRICDFVLLSTLGWNDFNVLVANLFSGFSSYAVQWQPTIRYPVPEPQKHTTLCDFDFALTVCATHATNRITIERARFLPLTISSPAVLIGCHASCSDNNGHLVSQDEIETLTQMMRPHLQVFDSYTQYKTFVPDNVAIDPRPYLFCSYIKPGFLHLLAFRLIDQSDVKAYLIDSLPLALECRGAEDMKNRLRAATALFTLQKEIVELCETWGTISWPVEVLADEHEAIMEVTGICSPTPSETIPEYAEGSKELLIPIPGTCLEDEPAFIAKQVAKSVERVTPWLAQLYCVEPPRDDDLEPWD